MSLVVLVGTTLGVSMTAGASLGLGAGVAAGIVGTGALGAAAAGIGTAIDDAVNADEAVAANRAQQQKYMANQAAVPTAVTDATGIAESPVSGLGDIGKQSAATGGMLTLKQGGHVPLKDGAYIIPADVVSALGNGSSKAGAEFLRNLLAEVRRKAIRQQGLGAIKSKQSA